MAGHAAAACARCATPVQAGARFCTGCGAAVDGGGASRTAGGARPPVRPAADEPRLVECEGCGAGNAASRPLCARCGTPLRDEVPGGDALPAQPITPPAVVPATRGRGVPPLLLALIVLAGLLTAGVLLSLVMARATAPSARALAEGVALRGAIASSAAAGGPASAVVDGDPATAWTPDDPVEGEWVEVALAEPVEVGRVVLWTGPGVVRIEVGDRQFRATLDPADGPVAVDLPEPVLARRVRVVLVTRDGAGPPAVGEVVVDAAG